MGRHEIRLRRKNMTSRMIERHKNYYEIMRKHKRQNQRNKLIRRITYFIFLVGISLLIYFSVEKLSESAPGNEEPEKVELEDKNSM